MLTSATDQLLMNQLLQISICTMSDTARVPQTLLHVQGVGPATASAMLTAVSASLPFMSDEAMAATLPGRPEYTVKKYLHLVTALRTKAESLTDSSGQLSKGTPDAMSHGC